LELVLPEVVVDMWTRYQQELWWLGIASAAMLVISALLVPFLIARMPADFYAEDNHRRRILEHRPLLRIAFLAVKNLLGAALLLAGIAMLVLPGQGILTILAALALLDFPGKRRLELGILKRPAILKSINWLRRRSGREALLFRHE
jgi:Putative transmembrane protein (PGPGW)